MGKVDVKQEAEAASLTGDATQVPSTKKGCRFRVPFALMLALAYSVLITTSGLIIFSQMQSSSKSSQERMFTVSKGNVNDIVRDLQGELAEKIGLKAFEMFSRPEQTVKKLAQQIEAGIWDPVSQRFQIVNQLIRADIVTQYAAVAFENGFFTFIGHFTTSVDESDNQYYDGITKPLDWKSQLKIPVYSCPTDATENLAVDRDNWVAITDADQGYILASHMHWTQALSEADGSIPSELVIGGDLGCRDADGNALVADSTDKLYSGWFQDTGDDDYTIDATINKGVAQEGFGFAEIWDANPPDNHFTGKTKDNYDFLTPMRPDNNVNGNWTSIRYMGPDSGNSENPAMRTGLTSWGVTRTMYNYAYDARPRQWYRGGKKLYDAKPSLPTGAQAFHGVNVGWFPMYLWQTVIPEIAVGLVTPLYGPSGEFVGVVDCDISVKAISKFLAQQSYGNTGVGYMVRADEILHTHGGVGIDDFVDMNYNNHVGAILGTSTGSDYGKACGNDFTNNEENDQYGPHYRLTETEWYNTNTGVTLTSANTPEMVISLAEYDAGGWICRTKADSDVEATIDNRALPATNHENTLISGSAKHVNSMYGSFNALKNTQKVGSTTFTADSGDTMLLQWFYMNELEFDGFKPLVIVVVPEKDFLGDIEQANEDAEADIATARSETVTVIIVSILVTAVISLLLAFVVTVPLSTLQSDIQKVARLEIDLTKKNRESVIREIGNIQNAYSGLKMGLGSFQKFVPSSVVKRIVGGDRAASELGVEKKQVTVMFTDIRGFTSLSEQLPLPTVMKVLEEYLTDMVEVIETNGGTVGDFIGDGIMIFWNSPNDQPDHAQLAVNTMFAMHEKLRVSNKKWALQGVPEIVARIGVNSGDALSGNIGSPVKMKFGVVGDTVNLASRVENLNKFYDGTRLISGSTYAAVKHTTICRLVDKVAVKGREGHTLLYEVLEKRSAAGADAAQKLADDTEVLVNKFWEKKFAEVVDGCGAILAANPTDGAILFLKERATEYAAAPPPANWDGVNRMAEK